MSVGFHFHLRVSNFAAVIFFSYIWEEYYLWVCG